MDLQYVLLPMLTELGIQGHCAGFSYLMDAIIIYHQHYDLVRIYGLYTAVVKRCEWYTTESQIESSIRRVIKAAWRDGDRQVWDMYFPNAKKKPANIEFIDRMSKALFLWEGCCKAQKQQEKEGVR